MDFSFIFASVIFGLFCVIVKQLDAIQVLLSIITGHDVSHTQSIPWLELVHKINNTLNEGEYTSCLLEDKSLLTKKNVIMLKDRGYKIIHRISARTNDGYPFEIIWDNERKLKDDEEWL